MDKSPFLQKTCFKTTKDFWITKKNQQYINIKLAYFQAEFY